MADGDLDTPYTGLIKHLVATEGRTRRAVRLLLAVAAAAAALLAVAAVAATVMGPAAAAVAGSVPLGSAVIGAALGALARRGRNR